MTNEEKGIIYDNCLRESDRLQRENSRLKSQYVTNIPPQIQEQINQNNARIAVLVNKLENLLR
jgi:hypothetical protein